MSSIKFAAQTNVGQKRQVNEDSLWPQTNRHEHQADAASGMLFIVADGMGGHGAGDIASNLAVTEISNNYYNPGTEVDDIAQRLEMAIHAAHQRVIEVSAQSPETANMGTTVVAAVVKFDDISFRGEAWLAWVGDSRIYLHRGGKLRQISRDHSRVWPLIEAGHISWDELKVHPDRSKITNALIAQRPDAAPETLRLDLEPGDKLLLCSDGLSGEVRPEDIEETLAVSSPEQAAAALIDKANAPKEITAHGQTSVMDGGNDNISLIIIAMPVDKTITQPLEPVVPRPDLAPTRVSAPVKRKSSRWGMMLIIATLLFLVGLVAGALIILVTTPSIFAPAANPVVEQPAVVPATTTEDLPAAQNAVIVAVGAGDEQLAATTTPVVAAASEAPPDAEFEARMPTVTRGPTQAPTVPATPTGTPTPLPTPTLTPAITLTVGTTLDVSNLPVPLLIEPEADEAGKFPRDTTRETRFVWQWPGDLSADLSFEIMVWLKDAQPTGAHDARFLKQSPSFRQLSDNRYSVSLALAGANGITSSSADYLWTVAVVRTEPQYEWLGIVSEPRPISLVVPDTGVPR